MNTQQLIDHISSLIEASHEFNEQFYLEHGGIHIARVLSVDQSRNRVVISLIEGNRYTTELETIYPGFMATPDGAGIWHGLDTGDTVLIAYGFGNRPFILTKITNIASSVLNVNQIYEEISSARRISINPDAFAIRAKLDRNVPTSALMSIDCKPNDGISIGLTPFSSLSFDYFPDTQDSDKYYSTCSIQAGQRYEFSESGYSINGIVLRTLTKPTDHVFNVRNQDRWYKGLSPVCLDPSRIRANTTDDSRNKNPPFVENRRVIFEFSESSNVEANSYEEKKQTTAGAETQNKIYAERLPASRRDRKNDTLSLSLVYPNNLIECVEGTLIDVYGNVLDINRNRIPVGQGETAFLNKTSEDYRNVMEQHRRGVAFHWELNARKASTEDIEAGGNDITDKNYGNNGDYSRDRSRLFVDIDKEGQFKINIPASSEKGNVPLLARYENISTTRRPIDTNTGPNFNTFVFPEEGQTDIVLDSFGQGAITLSGSEKVVPKNRFDGTPMKLGTAFHDISKTCCEPVFTSEEELYQKGLAIFGGPDELKEAVVTTTLNIDGESANAGGRSGTISLDGMLSVSVGANTVDRQSLWLDTAGGIVSRVGRDKDDISVCSQLDGHVYIQVGGPTISDDSRFSDPEKWNNKAIDTIFEIRIIGSNNRYHRIYASNKGLVLKSASNITIEASGNLILGGAQIVMNTEVIQNYTQVYSDRGWTEPMAPTDQRPVAAPISFDSGIDGDTGAA